MRFIRGQTARSRRDSFTVRSDGLARASSIFCRTPFGSGFSVDNLSAPQSWDDQVYWSAPLFQHAELDDRDTRLRGRSFRSLHLVIHAHRMRRLPGATPSLERQRRPRSGSHDRLAADGITTEVCMSENPAEHVRVRSGSRIRATTWGSRMLSPTFESMSAQNLLARDVLSLSWVFYRSPRTMRARVDSIRWRAQVELLLALACRRAARSSRTMGAIPSCDACGTPSVDAHTPEAEGGLTTDPRS